MEKAINIELIKYLERAGIINDRQYGFRHQRSTGDLLSYVTHVWESTLEKFGESRAVALDISKAFDRVWHEGLLNKLPSYGLPFHLCSWIANFLQGRSIQVVVDGHSSDILPTNAGVPQGSILSPTLFLLHINDLLCTTKNEIFSFADDSTLVASFYSDKPITAENCNNLRCQQIKSINEDLKKIVDWGECNLVDFNTQKTQATVFTKKVNQAGPSVVMSGSTLQPSPSISLLGVTVSSDLSWHDHVATIAKSASQKLGYLFKAKKYFTPVQLLLLYKSQIRPSLEYCSHIWSSAPKYSLNLLESVQRRAVRLIGDPSLTNSLQTLAHRRAVADLSLFYRYYHGRCSTQLASTIPPRAVFQRRTRQAVSAHPYTVRLDKSRTVSYQRSFFCRTAVLWNQLPTEVFPNEYNLLVFKRRAHKYLTRSGCDATPA